MPVKEDPDVSFDIWPCFHLMLMQSHHWSICFLKEGANGFFLSHDGLAYIYETGHVQVSLKLNGLFQTADIEVHVVMYKGVSIVDTDGLSL